MAAFSRIARALFVSSPLILPNLDVVLNTTQIAGLSFSFRLIILRFTSRKTLFWFTPCSDDNMLRKEVIWLTNTEPSAPRLLQASIDGLYLWDSSLAISFAGLQVNRITWFQSKAISPLCEMWR